MDLFKSDYESRFMGSPAHTSSINYTIDRLDHFRNYRNERISRMIVPSNEYGAMHSDYSPKPDTSMYRQAEDKHLNIPPSKFSMIDRERQQEVDDFYIACQLHRDQYRDDSGSLHPLDYFKIPEYQFQCPIDPTSRYLKYPEKTVKYKHPITFPVTLERSLRAPLLPHRVLTGVYSRSSDNTYKR